MYTCDFSERAFISCLESHLPTCPFFWLHFRLFPQYLGLVSGLQINNNTRYLVSKIEDGGQNELQRAMEFTEPFFYLDSS